MKKIFTTLLVVIAVATGSVYAGDQKLVTQTSATANNSITAYNLAKAGLNQLDGSKQIMATRYYTQPNGQVTATITVKYSGNATK